MYDNDSRGISYSAGFFMLIAFVIGGLFMAAIISEQIWIRATGLPFKEMANQLSNPEYSKYMKIIQAVNSIVGFLLPTIATAFMLHRRPMRLLGLDRAPEIRQAGVAVLLIAASLLVATAFSYVTHLIPLSESLKASFDKMEADYANQVAGIMNLKNRTDYLIAIVLMAFIPAVCEEVLFRGGLQNYLTRSTNRPWLAIIAVSILFSIAHLSYYGFLFRVTLGIVLGAIYYYSGKLWLSILAHFVNNALAITLYYLAIREGKPMAEAMRQEDTFSFWGILALPALIALLIVFRRISTRNTRLA